VAESTVVMVQGVTGAATLAIAGVNSYTTRFFAYADFVELVGDIINR
jgi:hypothetical protein